MSSPEPVIPSAQVRIFPPAGISLILAAGTVWAGRTVRDEPITEGLVVAGSFIVISTAIVNQVSRGFAAAFAALIFIAAFLAYGLDILRSIGVASQEG
ncbi:MAG: hypothetical protein AB7I44_21140 [Hyphomicrobiaceae bacterium]